MASTQALTSKFDALLIPIDPKNTKADLKTDLNFDPHKLWSLAHEGESAKANTTRIVYTEGLAGQKTTIAGFVSIGSDFSKLTAYAKEEAYRQAIATGVNKLGENGIKTVGILLGDETYSKSAAVGAHLSNFSFTLKTTKANPALSKGVKSIEVASKLDGPSLEDWKKGVLYAQAQNLTRELMELPANILTPTAFCKRVQKEFSEVPDTEVIIRDEEWAEARGMRTFLSVTKGTTEPAKFLEIHYKGAPEDSTPLVFVGKGITFDSGGISLKPALDMKLMRGDMGGAATVVAAALAIAKMKLPVNLIVCTPLCENMPGPSASKPGDIVYAMNGKSVEIDNTDAEGRLILADALHYANTTYNPQTLIDVATLTGAMEVSLGRVFTGVFSSSDSLWEEIREAGEAEFDRFWRMPLDEEFGPQIYSSNADLCNRGGKPGGSCTAALFLKAFVDRLEPEDGKDTVRWAHIDIAGTMEATRETPYQKKGMTGRATRGLIEFARRFCVAE